MLLELFVKYCRMEFLFEIPSWNTIFLLDFWFYKKYLFNDTSKYLIIYIFRSLGMIYVTFLINCYLYIYCMLPVIFIVYFLYIFCMLPVYLLYIICIFTVCYLYIYCVLLVFLLYVICIFTVYYLYIYCMLSVYFLYVC